MKRRTVLSFLLTLPFLRWFKPPELKVITTTITTKSRKLPMKWAGSDSVTVYGTDVNGNPISEVLELPPEGGTVVSKQAFHNYSFGMPPDQDPASIEFGIDSTKEQA